MSGTVTTNVAVMYGAANSNIYAIYSPVNNADLTAFPWGQFVIEAAGGAITVNSLTRSQFNSYATINALQAAFAQTTKPGTQIYP